ncbi:FAS1 domain-containing protein [Wilcoxina mikolae CBS 423.85]|nr:FAS1 domain-containing protein [Wilcoxina mikolae CBS 423.85]
MKINYLFTALSILSVPVYSQNLIDVLILHGFTEFARDLQLYPNLMAKFSSSRNDITVWAPINKAVTPVSASSRIKRNTLSRRQTEAEYSTQISHTGQPPTTVAPTRKRQVVDDLLGFTKRQAGLPASNFATLRTFLVDSTFVNLGPNQPGRVVSNYAAPPPGSDIATIAVSGGGGAITNQVSGPFKYDNGLIIGVDGFFGMPSPLTSTLTSLGLTTFRDGIIATGLEEKLNDTPAMTIFAFANDAIDGDDTFNVNEHTITSLLGYSPELVDTGPFTSDAGTKITVKFSGGSVFVNGIRIIKSDITMKNGVVHQLERPLHTYESANNKRK